MVIFNILIYFIYRGIPLFIYIEAQYLTFLATSWGNKKRVIVKKTVLTLLQYRVQDLDASLRERYRNHFILSDLGNPRENDLFLKWKKKELLLAPVQTRAIIQHLEILTQPLAQQCISLFDLHNRFNWVLKWFLDEESKCSHYLVHPSCSHS